MERYIYHGLLVISTIANILTANGEEPCLVLRWVLQSTDAPFAIDVDRGSYRNSIRRPLITRNTTARSIKLQFPGSLRKTLFRLHCIFGLTGNFYQFDGGHRSYSLSQPLPDKVVLSLKHHDGSVSANW